MSLLLQRMEMQMHCEFVGPRKKRLFHGLAQRTQTTVQWLVHIGTCNHSNCSRVVGASVKDNRSAQGNMKSPCLSEAPKEETHVENLQPPSFHHGKGMRERCIQATKRFLQWTAKECSMDVKHSIIDCEVIVTSVDPPDPVTKTAWNKMSQSEQELWRIDASEHCKMKSKVTRDSGRARETFRELCHPGLKQKPLGQKDCKSETANVESKASCGELLKAM